MYISLNLDLKHSCVSFIYSGEGGVNFDKVAELHPEKIHTLHVDLSKDLDEATIVEVALQMGIPEYKAELSELMRNMLTAYKGKDCSMIELNPLVLTHENKLVAADTKMEVDSGALFRHKELRGFFDIA